MENRHIRVLQEYAINIEKTKKLNPIIPSYFLISAYNYTKQNQDNYSNGIDLYMRSLALESCELSMPKIYICNCSANFNLNDDLSNLNRLGEEKLLNRLSNINRRFVINEDFFERKNYNLIDTENLCDNVSQLFFQFCQKNFIKCQRIKINFAFGNETIQEGGVNYHYFNIVEIGHKKYIFDATYKQFFKIKNNFLQSLGIQSYLLVHPGIYMLINDSRKETALKLLKKGYIEYNEQNLKNYCDGFALSFRNGLYYENFGRAKYETNYTSEDYETFLFTDDSQLNHEPKEFLGTQFIKLKDPNFDFSYHK